MIYRIVLYCFFSLPFWSLAGQNLALEFDGANDRVDIAAIGPYNFGSGSFTVEARVQFDGLSVPGAVVSAWTAQSCSQVGWSLIPETDGKLHFYIGDGGSICGWDQAISPVLNLNQCYHAAGVKDGNNLYLYLDGVLVGSGTTNKVLTGNIPLLIGSRYANFPNSYLHDGQISEVRIWNVARTQSDLQNSMNLSLTGGEPGLVGYWPLSDGPGNSSASDLSSNANHGSLVNMDPVNSWVNSCNQFQTVPTLSQWALILLGLVFLCIGGIVLFKKKKVQVSTD